MRRAATVVPRGCAPGIGFCNGAGGPGENPGIDDPWLFFGNAGMHLTVSPITQIGSTTGGAHLLDFSGWKATWNGIPVVGLGDPANFSSDTGVATITCSSASCSASSSYTLDYSAHIQNGDPSNWGGVLYGLHLEGAVGVAVVPVLPALWLLGSGLAGLAGVARRRKKR